MSYNAEKRSSRYRRIVWAGLLLILGLSACIPQTKLPTPLPVQTVLATRQRTPVSGGGKAPSSTPSPTPVKITVDASKLQGARVYFGYAWSGDAAAQVEKLKAEFNATNPWGIWVETQRYDSYSALYTAVLSLRGKAQQPTLITGAMTQALAWNSEQELVLDLTPYITDAQWGLSPAEIRDFPTGLWEGDEWNGMHLGLPAERDARLMVYNQTWAKELGFDEPPATTAAFETQVCAAAQSLLKDTDRENNGMGGWLVDDDANTAASWILAFGGELAPEGPGDSYRFDSAQTQAAFQYLRQLYDHDCIWIGRDPDATSYFANRRALFITVRGEALAGLGEALKAAGGTDDWTVLPFPAYSGSPVTLADGPSYQVLSAAPETELAAWLFARWMSAPQQQARLAQAGHWAPLRTSTLQQMQDFAAKNAVWKSAAELILQASPSPRRSSWQVARPVLGDAFTQLFSTDFNSKQIPDLLQQLDATIGDVLEQPQ